ncbi:hypothetical protein GGX14DRAFT_649404 [Mycena pura]|uniref:Uncharacterized protein n=1 Tax=Mycena pura TaxID=153505 RepID=A0AAD6YMY4_9AGAR|nr:hypothetical protein GGX14DRAFT_649404 [Mycena pura]
MRRGLPPLPPPFLSRGKRTTPSATASARPSHTPHPQSSSRFGRVQVFANDGSPLGHSINLDSSPGQDLRVRAVPSGELFNMIVVRPNSAAASYLGELAATDLSSRDFTVEQDRSSSGLGDKGHFQPSIWAIDPSTKELKALYTNPDGSRSPLSVAFDPRGNELHFVKDIDTFNTIYADFPTDVVKLYLRND